MKTRTKIFVFSFLFLVVSAPFSVSAAMNSPLVGQPKPTVSITNEPTGNVGSTVEKKPEYLLPYPGILPDHPLYFLKQVRDGILDRLIMDPLRKAEFHVLQADKRLNMGRMLVDNGKGMLAEQVISKGENYLERAVSGLSEFKSTGRAVPGSLIDRLTRSTEKHIEVLDDLVARTEGEVKAGFTRSVGFVKRIQGEVEKLK